MSAYKDALSLAIAQAEQIAAYRSLIAERSIDVSPELALHAVSCIHCWVVPDAVETWLPWLCDAGARIAGVRAGFQDTE